MTRIPRIRLHGHAGTINRVSSLTQTVLRCWLGWWTFWKGCLLLDPTVIDWTYDFAYFRVMMNQNCVITFSWRTWLRLDCDCDNWFVGYRNRLLTDDLSRRTWLRDWYCVMVVECGLGGLTLASSTRTTCFESPRDTTLITQPTVIIARYDFRDHPSVTSCWYCCWFLDRIVRSFLLFSFTWNLMLKFGNKIWLSLIML